VLSLLSNVFSFKFFNTAAKLNKGRCFEGETRRQVTGQSSVDHVFHLMQVKQHDNVELIQLPLFLQLTIHTSTTSSILLKKVTLQPIL